MRIQSSDPQDQGHIQEYFAGGQGESWWGSRGRASHHCPRCLPPAQAGPLLSPPPPCFCFPASSHWWHKSSFCYLPPHQLKMRPNSPTPPPTAAASSSTSSCAPVLHNPPTPASSHHHMAGLLDRHNLGLARQPGVRCREEEQPQQSIPWPHLECCMPAWPCLSAKGLHCSFFAPLPTCTILFRPHQPPVQVHRRSYASASACWPQLSRVAGLQLG